MQPNTIPLLPDSVNITQTLTLTLTQLCDHVRPIIRVAKRTGALGTLSTGGL